MAKNGKYAYMFGIQSQYYDEKQKTAIMWKMLI